MEFFKKIVNRNEISKILEIEEEQGLISLGKLIRLEPEQIKRLMNVWCKRIDKIIGLDKSSYGDHTWISQLARKHRGFTYDEFATIFNPHVIPEEFSYYPIFNSVRQDKGGINTEKQRFDFTNKYDLDEESFCEALRESGNKSLMEFFFEFARLSALLSFKRLKRHVHIVGATGSGKSVILSLLLYRMLKKYPKFSYILIDPHGDVAERVKRFKLFAKKKYSDKLIYIDPFLKPGYTPTFNPFEISDKSVKNITNTAEQIIIAFEEVLNRVGGKLTEVQVNALEKCIYFLLSRPQSTILDLQELLNSSCKESIQKEAKEYDPSFFDEYFFKPSNKTREALLSRVGRLLNSPVLKGLLGGRSTFNLEKALNSSKIIVFNLGGMGEMSAVNYGKFIISSIKSIIRKRKKNTGIPVFCMVDEVHNIMSGSFDFILSQLRGFGLHMILAHQFIGQLKEQAETVKENTHIKIIGGVERAEEVRSYIGKVPEKIFLKEYEFFLKVKHYPVHVFKAHKKFAKYPEKYEYPDVHKKELELRQINRYYKPYDGFLKIDERKSDEAIPSKPTFELFIDEND